MPGAGGVEWIVPPGKEDEYEEDAQGNPVHVKYGKDPLMRGTVLPSGKDRIHSGGNYAYTIDKADIPQNIIAYEENGQRIITTSTREKLTAGQKRAGVKTVKPDEATPETIAQLGEQAERVYSQAGEAAKKMLAQLASPTLQQKVAAVMGEHYNPFGEGSMAKKKAKKKKTAKRRTTKKKAQRVVKSEAEAPEPQDLEEKMQAEPLQPVVVKLTGPFGTVSAQFSGIFKDGMCLVLYTDARQVSSVYKLPESDDPVPLTVEFDGHVVECLWAGIRFTMPNVPVTFIVLLAAEEEQSDGEGQPGQMGLDPM